MISTTATAEPFSATEKTTGVVDDDRDSAPAPAARSRRLTRRGWSTTQHHVHHGNESIKPNAIAAPGHAAVGST